MAQTVFICIKEEWESAENARRLLNVFCNTRMLAACHNTYCLNCIVFKTANASLRPRRILTVAHALSFRAKITVKSLRSNERGFRSRAKKLKLFGQSGGWARRISTSSLSISVFFRCVQSCAKLMIFCRKGKDFYHRRSRMVNKWRLG